MHLTIFSTPIISSIFRLLCRVGMWLFGWKMEGDPPDTKKYVLIAAPHTSNWDLILTLCLGFTYRIEVYWLGKDTLFSSKYGFILKWLGGIPVVRSRSTNMVQRTVQVFNSMDELILIVPPEGTRGKVRCWKTGFYHIAYGAKVPIAMGFIDFKRKTGGFGPTFFPTGKIEEDMAQIQAFYKNFKGKREDLWSEDSVALKDKSHKADSSEQEEATVPINTDQNSSQIPAQNMPLE